MNDDLALLRRYAEEASESAFTELARRHMNLVYSVALRRVGGDAHLAEDVAQKVFTDLARKARSLITHPAISSWLYVSTHVASAAVVRAEQRRKRRETALVMDTLQPSAARPEDDWTRLRPLLDDIIVTLPETDRTAIALRYFERRSFSQIGAVLRVNEDAARKRVDRALEKLRTLLERRGVTSTATVLGLALSGLGTVLAPAELTARIAALALAQGTTTTSSVATALASLKTIAPLASVITAGIFLITAQRAHNRTLADNLAGLEQQHRSIVTLRENNTRLARTVAAADALRRAQDELPRLRAAVAAVPSVARPASANVGLGADGTIRWENTRVSLREFLKQLQTLPVAASGARGQITVRVDPQAEMSAVRYVLEEAAKVGFKLRMIPAGPIAPDTNSSWF